MIKSEALEELARATKKILPKYIQDKREINRSGIQRYDFSSEDANYDLEGLVQSLTGGKENTDYQSWRTAFDNVVTYWKTTPRNYSNKVSMFSMEGAEGLSTYIPTGASNSTMNTFYRTLSWYTAAGWDGTGW